MNKPENLIEAPWEIKTDHTGEYRIRKATNQNWIETPVCENINNRETAEFLIASHDMADALIGIVYDYYDCQDVSIAIKKCKEALRKAGIAINETEGA